VSAREREDGELAERIVEIFQKHRGVYGSPRIHDALKDEGIHVGRKRVVRLMQRVRLSAHCRTHDRVTTHANPAAAFAENVLDRDFEADLPNQKWVADVTSIGTASGWLYLAVVLDLFSRRVVGWAMGATFDARVGGTGSFYGAHPAQARSWPVASF
jgi:transposase InsO family protein